MTPAAMIRRLYAGIHGFGDTGAGPSGRVLRYSRARTYGELTSVGTRQLIATAGLSAADVFVDLGAGVGKVPLLVALSVPGIRCMGVEISGARHQGACQALQRAEALGWLAPGRCTFRHADVLKADLSGATALFANSTCFPEKLLGRIARRVAALDGPVTFVTLQRLPCQYGPAVRARGNARVPDILDEKLRHAPLPTIGQFGGDLVRVRCWAEVRYRSAAIASGSPSCPGAAPKA